MLQLLIVWFVGITTIINVMFSTLMGVVWVLQSVQVMVVYSEKVQDPFSQASPVTFQCQIAFF